MQQPSALRNQVHAILDRNLVAVDWASDVFGKKGRRGLAAVGLSDHDRDALECLLRLRDAVSDELPRAEGVLAKDAFARREVRRLMTIPGVGCDRPLHHRGDRRRRALSESRPLVGYLGLDPRVRQSGERAARTGHLSREGQSQARGLLTAWC